MATFSLLNATTWVAGHDFTGDTNQISLSAEAEELEKTNFGSGGYRERIAGLKTAGAELSGFWDSTPDAASFDGLGVNTDAVTVSPTGVEAEPAFLFQAGRFNYTCLGSIGEIAPFSTTLQGTQGRDGLVRGQLAKAKGNVSATTALGSVLNLGAPTAGQFVYVAVHVFAAGTTITLQLQSDTASNFPSATTQATIGPITTAGGTWMARLAGPFVGETHWRLNISAITGTFEVAAAIAVQ